MNLFYLNKSKTSQVFRSVLYFMIILHANLLVCYGQIIENGYYISRNNREDILYAYNDTLLLEYPSICGDYIFKGTVHKKNMLEALYLETDCSYFICDDISEASITKVIFSAYDGGSRKKIVTDALKCRMQGFDKQNKVSFQKLLKYEIIDSNYVCIIQENSFSHALLSISIEGCFLDEVSFKINKNEVIKGKVYFYPYLKPSPTIKIKFTKDKDKLILFYPKEISYPDITCIFCGKEKVHFIKTDIQLRIPDCLLKENNTIR